MSSLSFLHSLPSRPVGGVSIKHYLSWCGWRTLKIHMRSYITNSGRGRIYCTHRNTILTPLLCFANCYIFHSNLNVSKLIVDYIGILQDFPTNVKCLLYSSFFFRSLINFWARMTFVEQLADDRVSLDLPQGGWVPTCHKPLYPLKEGCPMSVQGLSKSKTLSRSPEGHGWRYNLYLPLSFHWCFLCNR